MAFSCQLFLQNLSIVVVYSVLDTPPHVSVEGCFTQVGIKFERLEALRTQNVQYLKYRGHPLTK